MNNIADFPTLITNLVCEDEDPKERMKRARALMGISAGMVVGLEGQEHAAECAFRVADALVQSKP